MAKDLRYVAKALIRLCDEVASRGGGLADQSGEEQHALLTMLRTITNAPSSPINGVPYLPTQLIHKECTISLPTGAEHNFWYWTELKEEAALVDREDYEIEDYDWRCVKGLSAEPLSQIARTLEDWLEFGCEPPTTSVTGENISRADQIPQVDQASGLWVKNTDAARLEGLETKVLTNYRHKSGGGQIYENGMCGKDKDGRLWRKKGTPNSHPWYIRKTLLSAKPT